MATLKDIAKASGVSIATVSYVINNGPREVSPATRERVLAAIRQLDYRPNAAARSLKGKKTDSIGVVFPHMVEAPLDNSYFAPVLAGILDVSTSRRTVCMLFTGLDWNDAEHNLSLYADGRCDGLILIAIPKTSLLIEKLIDTGLPFVLVGTHIPELNVTSVDVDNVLGARLATGHLLDLGHRRVGMLQGTPTSSSNDERTRGFIEAHEERGLPVHQELIQPGRYQHAAASAGASRLLSMPAEDRPTALYCGNDMLAVAAMQTAVELGLRVPDDVSIVGFDDYDFAAITQPALTTVRQPLRQIGAKAADLLLHRVHHRGEPPDTVLFEPAMVVRSSTRAVG